MLVAVSVAWSCRRARGEDMVGEAAGVGVLFADAPPGLVHQEPVEDVGRFVGGGRDGLGGERGESVGDVRVRLDAGFGPVPSVDQVEGFFPATGREELAVAGGGPPGAIPRADWTRPPSTTCCNHQRQSSQPNTAAHPTRDDESGGLRLNCPPGRRPFAA